MRTVLPWVEPPLRTFLRESEARVVLLMTGSGQVIAQQGFTRSLDVMAAAALGAGIVASTAELARLMGVGDLGPVAHQGSRGVFLAPFPMTAGLWVALIVYDRETTLGLVQLFFHRLAEDLRAAEPAGRARLPLLAERFEEELNASLRSLFGR
jgi:predicted regulator of Ras-like GTPase activity (Roadblock/LC7/MglB family)